MNQEPFSKTAITHCFCHFYKHVIFIETNHCVTAWEQYTDARVPAHRLAHMRRNCWQRLTNLALTSCALIRTLRPHHAGSMWTFCYLGSDIGLEAVLTQTINVQNYLIAYVSKGSTKTGKNAQWQEKNIKS